MVQHLLLDQILYLLLFLRQLAVVQAVQTLTRQQVVLVEVVERQQVAQALLDKETLVYLVDMAQMVYLAVVVVVQELLVALTLAIQVVKVGLVFHLQ